VSNQRIVLTAGATRADPVLEVLAEFPAGTTFSIIRAAAESLAAEFPGQVVAVEHDTLSKWVDNPPKWSRYLWINPAGFPDTLATERAIVQRKSAEALERVKRWHKGGKGPGSGFPLPLTKE
jgi:hypothetical protein